MLHINTKKFIPTAVACYSALMMTLLAQGPVGDEIKITFDRPVQVGSKMLPAGDYTIRQVTSASNPRVLEFRSQDGSKLDATVTAIPILQNTPPTQTQAILQDEGGGARLSRIWVQGKTYGYGFPGSAMSASQATAQARLTGSYTGAATASTANTEDTTAANRTAEAPATPPPAATPTPTPAPEATPAPTPAPAAETPAPAPTPEVPATGLGWAEVTMAGLMMAATGLVLFKWSGRRAN